MSRFTALDHTFDLDARPAALARFFDVALAALVPDGRNPDTTYGAALEGASVTISQDERELARGTPTAMLARLMTTINTAGIRSVGHLPVVHASAVVAGERAVLVPAAAGAGKSTICAALVAAGCQYLSDEAAPIDDRGHIVPYPKPIVVGEGSWPVLDACREAVIELEDVALRSWWIDPARLGAGPARAPVPVGMVVVPRYRAGSSFEVEPLSAAEATATMSSNAFTLRQTGRTTIERLAAVAVGATNVQVTYGSLDDVCAFVLGENTR